MVPMEYFYLSRINRAKREDEVLEILPKGIKTSNRSCSGKTSHRKHACLIVCIFAPHGMDPTITTYACHVRWRRQQGLGRLVAVRRAADKGRKRVDVMQALGLFKFLPYSRAVEIFRTAVLADRPALASGIHSGNLHGLLGSVWAWHVLQDTWRMARNGIKGCME